MKSDCMIRLCLRLNWRRVSIICYRKANRKAAKMLDFSFLRHSKLNLPEEHIAAVEKHLRKRASQLIGLSKARNH